MALKNADNEYLRVMLGTEEDGDYGRQRQNMTVVRVYKSAAARERFRVNEQGKWDFAYTHHVDLGAYLAAELNQAVDGAKSHEENRKSAEYVAIAAIVASENCPEELAGFDTAC